MNRFLALGAIVATLASACLGSGSAAKVPAVTHSSATVRATPAWLVSFASHEARALGDPSVKTALVAPITADQARIVFEHRRRAYPGHTYLVVLHGSFVSPRIPCSPEEAGCFYSPRLFGWQVMLASPALGRVWRYFGIETNAPHLGAMPVTLRPISLPTDASARPTGLLYHFAVAQARAMEGSQMRAFGFARLSTASASRLFGRSRAGGYLVIEHGLFRRTPGAAADRDPWFWWAALEYSPSLGERPAAFRVLADPRRFVRRVARLHVSWKGVPFS